jgi:demethylmenaquinone methyltransferase/2-methoxy-6-polyprenyl-1,4-benzoquinol methylase
MSRSDTRLRDAFKTSHQKRAYVRELFATIADRYDLITGLLSYGQDRRWKRRLVSLAGPAAGLRALDLACGTGDITFALAAAGARTVGLDITTRMLELAARKQSGHSMVAFVAGDMMSLPFTDSHFDIVSTGYGIRNVPAIAPAFSEILRVLRPGGVLVSLDFNRPANALVRAVYLTYLTAVGSMLGTVLHRNPDTYRYIPESIRRYPGAASVCDIARSAGFETCEWFPVLGGLMAIHRATKAGVSSG